MMEELARELSNFWDGCLAIVIAIVIFAIGFVIGYAVGRAYGVI